MKKQQADDTGTENVGRAGWAIVGALLGLIAGFFLFVWSYKPITGLGGTPAWQVSLIDGLLIAGVGSIAFVFRKRSGLMQGILISAAILFVVNGLCGIGGR